MATFCISMVFLVMQFLWKYIDDLMGKGLGNEIILELLLYASADLIPMALPLAVLLSSIMVFGKFGELSELTAMKSTGISLFRIFLPLTTLVFIMSIGGFFFSNYTWPSAHFKMRVLISDIANQKTSLQFKEGEYFNEIPDHSIYIGKKIDDSHFEKITISDMTVGQGYRWREIYAERAEIKKSKDGAILLINLYDGFSDEELVPNSAQKIANPFRHTDFKKLSLTLDLSQFTLRRTDLGGYQESLLFKNYEQLSEDADSLKNTRNTIIQKSNSILKNKLFLFRDTNDLKMADSPPIPIVFETADSIKRKNVFTIANRVVTQSVVDINSKLDTDIYHTEELIVFVDIARNRIFSLSIAILVLFFIGAPLGAIAKKGGIGYPVMFAVIFFLFYYMLSITGEKLAKQGVLSPFMGVWLSTFVLAPIALFLSVKANNDSVLFDKEFYKKLIFWRRKK